MPRDLSSICSRSTLWKKFLVQSLGQCLKKFLTYALWPSCYVQRVLWIIVRCTREKRCKMRYKLQLFWKNYYDNHCKNSFMWRCYWKGITLQQTYAKKQVTAKNFKIAILAFFPLVIKDNEYFWFVILIDKK